MSDFPFGEDAEMDDFFNFLFGGMRTGGRSRNTLFEDCSVCPAFESCNLPARAEWVKNNQPKPVTASQVQEVVRQELKGAFARAEFVTPAQLQTALADSEKRIVDGLYDRLPSVRFGRWIMSFVEAPKYIYSGYVLCGYLELRVTGAVLESSMSATHREAQRSIHLAKLLLSDDEFERHYGELERQLHPEYLHKVFVKKVLADCPRGTALGHHLGMFFNYSVPAWFEARREAIADSWQEHVAWPFDEHVAWPLARVASRARRFFRHTLPAKRKNMTDRFFAWILPIKIDHL